MKQVKPITIRLRNRAWVQCGELNHYVDVHITTSFCLNDRSHLNYLFPFPLPSLSAPMRTIFFQHGNKFQQRIISLYISVQLEKNAAKNSMGSKESLLINVAFRMFVQSRNGTCPNTRLQRVQIRVIILSNGILLAYLYITSSKALRSVARRW